MTRMLMWFIWVVVAGSVAGQSTEKEALAFQKKYNKEAQVVWSETAAADWNYNTNLTDYNLQISLDKSSQQATFDKKQGEIANSFNWRNFTDPTLSREFSKIVDIGTAVLSEKDFNRMNYLTNEMQRIFSTAKVCNRPNDSTNSCYPLDPSLSDILYSSTNWDELAWAWKGWRDESGAKMADMYEEFVDLLNKAAALNGHTDNGAYWRSWYEDDLFRAKCEQLWQEILPLYQQLHTYIRSKLQTRYPEHPFPASGHIPAHLLSNMWAQSWDGLEDFVRPAPNKPGLDVTHEMLKQNYTVLDIFRLSEDFFVSLGLIKMPPSFWNDTMFVRPVGRDVVCHASAWDFYNQRDFRIKQCTEIDMNWLSTTHHEMGHIEYFLQYQQLPVKFRDGANPGFHEAIGDTMSLSVNTPEHLKLIGLLPDFSDDPDGDLNFLMKMALEKLAFIPFGYLIDQWRWDVFDGTTNKSEYNRHWWNKRCKYQGVYPPVPRSDKDFDAASKYHVPANTPYIRYFVSHILQFDFQKSMCKAAGNKKPLHRCDVYNSKEAGNKLAAMMSLGSSVDWHDALESLTGRREMSAAPIVEYFKPLLDWLRVQNKGKQIGWTQECPAGSFQ